MCGNFLDPEKMEEAGSNFSTDAVDGGTSWETPDGMYENDMCATLYSWVAISTCHESGRPYFPKIRIETNDRRIKR